MAGQHGVDDRVEHHRHLADEDRPRLEGYAARDRRVDGRIGGETAQASARPADALPLPLRELLKQSPDDDGFVPGLEIDGIDSDLVEVSALVRALLDVDVWVTRGEGKLHRPA